MHSETILVVSIGRLTAFYVVLVPMEFIPSEPPHGIKRVPYCIDIYGFVKSL